MSETDQEDKTYHIPVRDEGEGSADGGATSGDLRPAEDPESGPVDGDPVIVAIEGQEGEDGIPPVVAPDAEEAGERHRYLELMREHRRLEEELRKAQAALYQEKVRVQAAEEKLTDRQAQLGRAQAEFQNYRRRIEREKEEAQRYAFADLLAELLPVLDNFDRAMSAPARPETADDFHRGIALIQKQLQDLLARFELVPLVNVGQPFDPNRHEAVTRVESGEVAVDCVVSDLQRGYMYKDRLLRPALVAVSSGPPGGGGADPAAAAGEAETSSQPASEAPAEPVER
jgi:molecular chaperone GrpE